MCTSCAKRVQEGRGKCPVCTGPIQRLQTIFLAGVRATDNEESTSGGASKSDVAVETKETGIDTTFVIRNNIRPFAPIGTRGVGHDILDLIRDMRMFNFIQNGITGAFTTTLRKATDTDVRRIVEKLRKRGLALELKSRGEDKTVYEIKRV